MSSALYSTRLWWYGGSTGRGAAKLHGREVPLRSPPAIGGREVWMIDYVPEIGLQRIQYVGDAPRDMERAPVNEIREADIVLRDVTAVDSEW